MPVALLVLPLSVGAASLYGNTDVTVTADTNAAASVSADVDAQGSAGAGNDSAQNDAVVNVNVDASGNQVQASNDANMSAEFKLFTDDVKVKNERVEAVAVNGDGSVDVAYRHDAKFLGFIPMKLTSHTIVKTDADGNVSVAVKLPWWSFLVGGVSKVKADVEASLKANAEVKAEAGVAVSDEMRARIINAVVSSLNAEAQASVDAQAQTSTQASY